MFIWYNNAVWIVKNEKSSYISFLEWTLFNLENKDSFETIGESRVDYKIEIEEQCFHDR